MERESLGDKIFRYCVMGFLCITTFVALVPLLSVASMSLSSKVAVDTNRVSIWPVQFTLDSWKYILSRGDIWRSLGITAAAAVIGTVIALLITAMFAYPLSKKEFGIGKVVMLGVVITMIFKAPVIPYFLTVRNLGLYNNPLVLIVPHILSGYNLAIMRSFFKQFPAEVEEAAVIDGCGYFQVLFRIVLPSSTAVLATLGLFYGVTIWNQFQNPLLFIQNADLFPLQLKIRQLINDSNAMPVLTALDYNNYNDRTLRAAVVMFAIVPIASLYIYLQKYLVKGAMLGSVKG